MEFNGCDFFNNSGTYIIEIKGKETNPASITIKDTNYSSIKTYYENYLKYVILLSHATLILVDSVSFYYIINFDSIIFLVGNSKITISGTVKFKYNHVLAIIDMDVGSQYITIKENSVFNISDNEVETFFHSTASKMYPQPYCIFQYFTFSANKIKMEPKIFQITFYNNLCNGSDFYDFYMPTANCHWILESSYQNMLPQEVNNYYIKYLNNTGTCDIPEVIEQSSLCMCSDGLHYDCHINDLGYLYPGQTLTISLHHLHHSINAGYSVAVNTDITQEYVTLCTVLDISEHKQIIDNNCTKLHYTIGFPTENWCELFLKIFPDSNDDLNMFYIRQITCPTGFVKIDKKCQCDPVLGLHLMCRNNYKNNRSSIFGELFRNNRMFTSTILE